MEDNEKEELDAPGRYYRRHKADITEAWKGGKKRSWVL
jgi:hypothetical protein